jgi:hypothetical protein
MRRTRPVYLLLAAGSLAVLGAMSAPAQDAVLQLSVVGPAASLPGAIPREPAGIGTEGLPLRLDREVVNG